MREKLEWRSGERVSGGRGRRGGVEKGKGAKGKTRRGKYLSVTIFPSFYLFFPLYDGTPRRLLSGECVGGGGVYVAKDYVHI